MPVRFLVLDYIGADIDLRTQGPLNVHAILALDAYHNNLSHIIPPQTASRSLRLIDVESSVDREVLEVDDGEEGEEDTHSDSENKEHSDNDDDNDEETDVNTVHNPHQYTNNTRYKMVHGEREVVFATGQIVDPQPAVHPDKKSDYRAGDYMLMKGSDIEIKTRKGGVSFDCASELILQKDWSPFDDDMTAQDLHDLGDEEFLVWFQVFEAPPEPKKPSTKAALRKKKR